MSSRSIKRNFLYNTAYQILLIITPLVTTPWLSRTIGAAGNGIFTYTQSIANYFVLVSTLGISNYGVREVAACGDDRIERSRVFWETITMSASVGLLVLVVYIAYVIILGGEYKLYWILWGMWVLGSVADPSWLFFGCQEFRMPTIRSFATRLLSVVAILYFVRDAGDTWAYVAAISGAYMLNSLLLWPFVCRHVDWYRPSINAALSRLAPNITLFVPVLAVSLYTLMDKVMLKSMTDVFQVGLYDYAEKISKMPMAVVTALGAVVLPKMTEVVSAGRLEEGVRLVGDTMWFMLACAFALSFGIAAVAPEFVPLFFGEGYEACVTLMRVLCSVIPLICATNVLGVQYLLPCHRDRDFTLSVILGAIVNVFVNLQAIPKAEAMGAAWATVVSEVVVLLIQVWVVRKELPIFRMLTDSLPFIFMGLIMLVGVRLFVSVIGLSVPSISGLAAEVMTGAFIYLTLAWGWCNITHNERLQRILPSFAKW